MYGFMYFNEKVGEKGARPQPVTIIRGSKAIIGRRREEKKNREMWKTEQERTSKQ